ncbi:MAG: tetratricopeptide repeat protein [Deltaproteobacteria bacterium]|nr:tetratricopeptide repeat protein [Deltaproteobacteria bacterium]
MYTCPSCKNDDVVGKERCRCGADLGLLQRFVGLSDAWFNRALALQNEGRYGRALELLSACCVVRPDDSEARLVQAQMFAQLGCWREAGEALQAVRELDPDQPELAALEAALAEAGTQRSSHDTGVVMPLTPAFEQPQQSSAPRRQRKRRVKK